METIKFNGKEYQLVSGGYQLRDTSGRIIFLPGDVDFATIKNDLKTATSLELLDSAGKTIASRTDLVYAGRLQEDESLKEITMHDVIEDLLAKVEKSLKEGRSCVRVLNE